MVVYRVKISSKHKKTKLGWLASNVKFKLLQDVLSLVMILKNNKGFNDCFTEIALNFTVIRFLVLLKDSRS